MDSEEFNFFHQECPNCAQLREEVFNLEAHLQNLKKSHEVLLSTYGIIEKEKGLLQKQIDVLKKQGQNEKKPRKYNQSEQSQINKLFQENQRLREIIEIKDQLIQELKEEKIELEDKISLILNDISTESEQSLMKRMETQEIEECFKQRLGIGSKKKVKCVSP